MSGTKELALAGGGLNRPTASERFTAAAWRLLTGERENSQVAVAAIRAQPEVLEEIKREWESLQAAIEPCGDAVVHESLLAAATVYGSPWDDERLAAVGMAKYFAVLSDLPTEAVLRGFEDYDRQPDSRFFPRPGQLLALCEPHARKLRVAAGRAKMAKERLPSRAAERTPEEKARDRQALIDAGHMNPDGTFKPLALKTIPEPSRPRETQQQAADRARRAAAHDEYLQGLRENPIRRGREEDEKPSELFE